MHYILFYDMGDAYVARRTQYRSLHLEHIRRTYEQGDLVLAGPLAEPVDGAVLVFRGSSPEKAEEFAKTDPYVINGLVTGWRVRKWMTVIGEDATPP
jgi:hypothetical protein